MPEDYIVSKNNIPGYIEPVGIRKNRIKNGEIVLKGNTHSHRCDEGQEEGKEAVR